MREIIWRWARAHLKTKNQVQGEEQLYRKVRYFVLLVGRTEDFKEFKNAGDANQHMQYE